MHRLGTDAENDQDEAHIYFCQVEYSTDPSKGWKHANQDSARFPKLPHGSGFFGFGARYAKYDDALQYVNDQLAWDMEHMGEVYFTENLREPPQKFIVEKFYYRIVAIHHARKVQSYLEYPEAIEKGRVVG